MAWVSPILGKMAKAQATKRWQLDLRGIPASTKAKIEARADENLRTAPKEVIAILNAAVSETK